jgi:hypothetical protein
MNRYGQMALEFSRQHRPNAYSQISDPHRLFDEAGEAIQAGVIRLRDGLLGAPRPDENPEDYRLRSYQALTTAEELTLADHHLFQPEAETETEQPAPGEDADLDRYFRHLDEINRSIHNAP